MGIEDELKSVLGNVTQNGNAAAALQGAVGGTMSGNPLGGAVAGLLGGSNPLLQMLVPMLVSGGLAKILGGFHHHGMTTHANSWVAKGDNATVTPDQVQQALGTAMIGDLAAKSGLSNSDVSAQLAASLPGIVDGLTPNETMPTEDELLAMLHSPTSS